MIKYPKKRILLQAPMSMETLAKAVARQDMLAAGMNVSVLNAD